MWVTPSPWQSSKHTSHTFGFVSDVVWTVTVSAPVSGQSCSLGGVTNGRTWGQERQGSDVAGRGQGW